MNSSQMLNESIFTPKDTNENAFQNNFYKGNFQLNGCDIESEYMPIEPDTSHRDVNVPEVIVRQRPAGRKIHAQTFKKDAIKIN